MKYMQKIRFIGLVGLLGCGREKYQPFPDEVVFSVKEEKVNHNLWVRIIESKRKEVNLDTPYKIYFIDDNGRNVAVPTDRNDEGYLFYVGLYSKASCRNFDTKIKTPHGMISICDYLPK